MKRERRLLNLLWPLLAGAWACQAQQGGEWSIRGLGPQSRWESAGGTNVWSNGVILTNETSAAYSDKATESDTTSEMGLEGDVTILDHGHIWRGTNFIYNFKTGEVRAGRFKTMQAPFSMSGERMGGVSNKVQRATNVVISTDDYERPVYTIHARRATIAPGDYLEAHQATVYIGKVPVFYYPYYRKSLKPHPYNWEFEPGYRSLYGPYLLSSFNWYGMGVLDGTIHADEREKRGEAGGPDLQLHLGDWGEAAFRYYYAHDHDPEADGIAAPHLGENRQRGNFYYEAHPATNVTAKVVANYQSDPLMIRDFYTAEYNKNVEPASFGEVNAIWDNWVLDGMAQPRLVNFFETVERLPDVRLEGLRQELGATPIYYESETSAGYFKRAYSDTNVAVPFTNYTLLPDGLGYAATRGTYGGYPNYMAARADTLQQFILPETLFGWLNVDPRAGGRATYYSAVEGPQARTNQQGRGVFNTGVDVSLKASRVFPEAQSGLLDVQGLRHIIEPELDYVYVPTASSRVPQFDYQQPSLRLGPIDFPEYNSIDSITRENVLRLMLRNKLQTKRRDGVEDLVNWAVYADWDLTPGTNHSFTDVYSDLSFRPRSWLTFISSTRYDVPDTRWREAIERIVIQPTTALSVSLGYYYLMNNDPEFLTYPGEDLPGHNLVDFSLYYRVNENWGARIEELFEGQNGTMERQLYSIYRDLRSWTSAVTFSFAQGPGQPTDFTATITFSLKAFPRYKPNSDVNQQPLLMNNSYMRGFPD